MTIESCIKSDRDVIVCLARDDDIAKNSDIIHSKRFPEIEEYIKRTGHMIPISNYYLKHGKLPSIDDMIGVVRDGGRCVILPEPIDIHGKNMLVGIKGAGSGFQNWPSDFKPTDEKIKKRILDYQMLHPGPGSDLYISSQMGTLMNLGGLRPLGGQARNFAEWGLKFSEKLSNDFEYLGAHFLPTVAVVGYDEKSKMVLDNLHYGKPFDSDNIVQEYRLLPSNVSVSDFFKMSMDEMHEFVDIDNEKQKDMLLENFSKSLYDLAMFPMNNADLETLEYLDLNYPMVSVFVYNKSKEQMISPNGTVYFKDMENMAIHDYFQSMVKQTEQQIRENAVSDSYGHLVSAVSVTMMLQERLYGRNGGTLNEGLSKLEVFLEDFIKMMGHNCAGNTEFLNYDVEKDPRWRDNEYWNKYIVTLNYSNPELGEGDMVFAYVNPTEICPRRPYFGSYIPA